MTLSPRNGIVRQNGSPVENVQFPVSKWHCLSKTVLKHTENTKSKFMSFVHICSSSSESQNTMAKQPQVCHFVDEMKFWVYRHADMNIMSDGVDLYSDWYHFKLLAHKEI